MKTVKLFLILMAGLLVSGDAGAQMKDPATWKYEAKRKFGNRFEVFFHIKLEPGWHVYALNPGKDEALLPPVFKFDDNKKVKLVGGPRETTKPIETEMEGIEGVVRYFDGEATFIQEVEVTAGAAVTVTGTYQYQVCNDKVCLPPKTKPFKVIIKP